MLLNEAREAYYENSGKASDIGRTLAFSGIALIWIFRSDGEQDIAVPERLTLAAIFLAASLVADLLQYLLGTAIWGIFHRFKEVQLSHDEEKVFLVPGWINGPALVLFWLKQLLLLCGFFVIMRFLAQSWQVWPGV